MTKAPAEAPFLISWNLTRRCNLRCGHCYLDAGELGGSSDTGTKEALRTVDEISSLSPSAMLILTGGEPLLRPDIFDIASYASSKGLTVVVGTNGTLLTKPVIDSLLKARVSGVGISLDSASPSAHDRLRGAPGAWRDTMRGIDALDGSGLPFQVQMTITKENAGELDSVIELSRSKGATAVNIFFLVCTGRGQQMTDLSPSEYTGVLEKIASKDASTSGMMVRARCAPHIVMVASRKDPDAIISRGGTSGCIAATGYMRITPEGLVTPCPYIAPSPDASALGKRPIKEIWENDPIFRSIRSRELLGRCGSCEFKDTCGGCRARALASGSGISGEDPWCTHTPSADAQQARMTSAEPVWTPEATERLQKVPAFLRPMIKKGAEAYARSKGMTEITADVLATLKKRANR